MTPDPLIVSIPHTGTRFLKERLGVDAHVHTSTNWDAVLRQAKGRELIAPLRSPNSVWRSWCRRRDAGDPLRWVPHFFSAWYIMHTLDMMFGVDFICVDKREDPRIDDWTPFADTDESHVGWKLHQVDLRVLYKLPFVYQNYLWGQK